MPPLSDVTSSYIPDSDAISAASAAAAEVGAPGLPSQVGSLVRLLVRSIAASHVVEIGTGTGAGGLWALDGMGATGTLTSIDTDAEFHRIARATFTEAGYPTSRVRLITGRPREILPRFADGAYDIVWCRSGRIDYPFYLGEAIRMLRPGGFVIFSDAVGKTLDPAARDAESVALRELREAVLAEERLLPALANGTEGSVVALRTQ